MRHSNKHHHRQKDQKHHRAASLDHADSQLFTSAENHSYIMLQTATEALLTLLLNICDHSQLAAPILPGKPEQFHHGKHCLPIWAARGGTVLAV